MKHSVALSLWTRACPALLATTLSLFMGGVAHAQIVLNNITTYSVNGAGDAAGGQLWDTIAGGNYDVFVINSGSVSDPIINPNTRNLSLALTGGTYTFTLLTEPGSYTPNGGLSLFFDNSTSAQISGYNPFQNTTSPTTTPPTNNTTSNSIYNPFGGSGLAPGTLTYTSAGGQTATLTSLEFFNSGVDRISPTAVGASGTNDLGVRFTLNVSSIGGAAAPEPGSIALLAGGFPALGFLLLRRRRSPQG